MSKVGSFLCFMGLHDYHVRWRDEIGHFTRECSRCGVADMGTLMRMTREAWP